ncbi:LuxR family transcriptional regulator [Humibacter sp. BT305]|nr:LuxR family transcriptional regulator [Humibacter sp. BT305]
MALVRTVQALLGGGDTRALFEEAVKLGRTSGASFELARTQLLFGEWLRRERRIIEARAQLRAALAAFQPDSLAPMVGRAATELRAADEALASDVGQSRTDPASVLTAQELQTAQLAASGLSNREIADQVYLSHRTVGAHLRRAFVKLGVSRRSQLASALGGD